ncbi:bifunctional aminoglycoside phosphotransferase/ATP-binding protein [Radicibacter daui]|uniref:bifunctional aminoglycoside phosphotransferase/ATP-binding protein n=1 Tax=Radicibacter daui TaxID=3064829 RepID=UPI004046A4E1
MPDENQSAAIEFVKKRAGLRTSEAAPVEVIETHISLIVLAGDCAFKMKRAVRLPYVDFSTPERRLGFCEREVALNAPAAPGLYLGCHRITRAPDGSLELNGEGDLVDAVIEMRRFDQSALFDRMAERGALTVPLMERTAIAIARFHAQAPVITESGAGNLRGVLDINRAGFATSQLFDPAKVAALDQRFRSCVNKHAARLDLRSARGKVRRCHGDLHLRNICLIDGKPALFDCIEFNDQIAKVDTLYDLAFLLMDLWHRGLPGFANLIANRYLDITGDDEDGFVLLPLLMAVRAAVRAHVTATQIENMTGDTADLASQARAYFALAEQLLEEVPGRLLVLGGLSGSGKSTVAAALAPRLAPPPGARLLESDRLRKALYGVVPDTRLPPDAYRPEVSARVYEALYERSVRLARDGAPVIANAVFDREQDRAAFATAAGAASLRLEGFWLEADAALLEERVAARSGGASDATVDVLKLQLARDRQASNWLKLDAARPPQVLASDILAARHRRSG